jgi:hypothetical protein
MKKCNKKYIPEAGYCFKEKEGYALLYTCPIEDIDRFEEIEIGTDITDMGDNQFIVGGKFMVELNDETKKTLVNKLFSNDDQIAIILNYNDSKTVENKELYNLMQNWRKWFSNIIKRFKE